MGEIGILPDPVTRTVAWFSSEMALVLAFQVCGLEIISMVRHNGRGPGSSLIGKSWISVCTYRSLTDGYLLLERIVKSAKFLIFLDVQKVLENVGRRRGDETGIERGSNGDLIRRVNPEPFRSASVASSLDRGCMKVGQITSTSMQ